MIKLLSVASISAVFLILGGCATDSHKHSWLACGQDMHVVSTFEDKSTAYLNNPHLYTSPLTEVVSCELPKPSSVKTIGNKNSTHLWTMPSGKVCSYDKGPAKHLLDRGVTTVYGLRRKGSDNMGYDCEYDIGFMPVKRFNKDEIKKYRVRDIGVIPFKSNSVNDEVYSNGEVRVFSPQFKNGLVYSDALILEQRNSEKLQYSALLRKADGDIIKNWNAVEVQTYGYYYYDNHGNKRIKESKNFLFDIGNTIAFVNNSAKVSNFVTKYFADGYQEPNPRLMHRDQRLGAWAQEARDDFEYNVRKRESQTLHLVDGATMSEIKTLKAEEFDIQPMVYEDSTIHWNIIGPLKNHKGLFGLLQESGSFLPPPGTLGIKPVWLNTRLHGNENIYAIDRKEIEQRVPRFWLVAYDNKKGGYAWGKASADFSMVSEPIWSNVSFEKDGWLFAQRLDNNQWVSIDDFDLGLSEQLFSSAKNGMAHIDSIIDNVIAARKKQKSEELMAQIRLDEKIKARANIEYEQAKRIGDVAAMRVAVNNNSDLRRDFLLSGYASDQEIQKYLKYTIFKGDVEKTLQAQQNEKQKVKQYRLEQMRQQAALDEHNRKELERLQRYANKKKDLENWRNTVSENISKTNTSVTEQWNKHQTDMYKKGYIELPK